MCLKAAVFPSESAAIDQLGNKTWKKKTKPQYLPHNTHQVACLKCRNEDEGEKWLSLHEGSVCHMADDHHR